MMLAASARRERPRDITIGPVGLEGMLGLPEESAGIVLFAHGTGSGRFSPRNNFVARALREAGFATRAALAELRCEKHLAVVPGATHLFEEPGALETVVDIAGNWFASHLAKGAP